MKPLDVNAQLRSILPPLELTLFEIRAPMRCESRYCTRYRQLAIPHLYIAMRSQEEIHHQAINAARDLHSQSLISWALLVIIHSFVLSL